MFKKITSAEIGHNFSLESFMRQPHLEQGEAGAKH